jgi:hypothetical protein
MSPRLGPALLLLVAAAVACKTTPDAATVSEAEVTPADVPITAAPNGDRILKIDGIWVASGLASTSRGDVASSWRSDCDRVFVELREHIAENRFRKLDSFEWVDCTEDVVNLAGDGLNFTGRWQYATEATFGVKLQVDEELESVPGDAIRSDVAPGSIDAMNPAFAIRRWRALCAAKMGEAAARYGERFLAASCGKATEPRAYANAAHPGQLVVSSRMTIYLLKGVQASAPTTPAVDSVTKLAHSGLV